MCVYGARLDLINLGRGRRDCPLRPAGRHLLFLEDGHFFFPFFPNETTYDALRPDLRHRKQIQAHTVGGLIGEVIDERALWRESRA